MAFNLPDILNALTIFMTAARRASADCRKLAADEAQPEFIRDEAKKAADEIDATLSGASIVTVTTEAVRALQDSILRGRSIVQHQPTETF